MDYDPTYLKTTCAPSKGQCKYAFAKIRDAGFYDGPDDSATSTLPTVPLVDINGDDFTVMTHPTPSQEDLTVKNALNMRKCLPDNGVVYSRSLNNFRELIFDDNDISSVSAVGYNNKILSLINDSVQNDYYYRGPYRLISVGSWALPTAVAIGENAIFKGTFDNSNDLNRGAFSFLFPRAGKLTLDKNISYVGSDDPLMVSSSASTPIPRAVEFLPAAGESKWMDGCNIRVSYYDSISNEGIGSCNVTAAIELVVINKETGAEEAVELYSKSDIKLQLLRRSKTDYTGKETLYQSMRSCVSSRSCPADHCCYNYRCWSKSLISQCPDDATSEGNLQVGDICTTDYQCASLCCNSASGRCAVNDSTISPPVSCSKSPGDNCVAREWCRQESIKNCMIVLTGRDVNGTTTCALRCYNQLVHGTCVDGKCIAPTRPVVPSFDPAHPDCRDAKDPPLIL
ncbi:MAG: hypothetical protein HQK53_04390 [Oligoflexia bacterium]|nr:hypothetical protein [Oligoflexia bacterium]